MRFPAAPAFWHTITAPMPESHFHWTAFHWVPFVPRRPRHRLLRACCNAIGLILLCGLVLVGLLVGSLVLLAALALRALRQAPSHQVPAHGAGRVLDGEYVLVRPRTPPLLPR